LILWKPKYEFGRGTKRDRKENGKREREKEGKRRNRPILTNYNVTMG
jgi:hypothetical protein